ncbi:glycerophosphodiester phosphodiesterase [Pedobacter africanus]|uniref:Glycerophosphoryl diester phosphodiesterase n=1 Tax=Pedobacter africanus TaxID=151894 RepID=A0A1W2DX06_9SPHI|nr:glycerophosphodiester phosphodiesterase [Pedobacter africanus]SMD01837.1 glycerophosphoryl diester phosphodiesterase [Pedobacter africanus]
MFKKQFLCLLISFSFGYQASYAQSKPEWHAHRGFRGLMPESTIAAMKNAVDLKADVLEFDITFTKDKKAVISHDPFLDYLITLDKNGKEIEPQKKMAIYQMSYKDVKSYDVGSRQHKDFPQQKNFKAHIPLLAELLDSIEAYVNLKNYPKPTYNIETKTSKGRDGIYQPAPEEFVKRMMKVIYKAGVQDRVIIQSFDPRTLEIVRRDYPKVAVMLITVKGSLADNMKKLTFLPDYYAPSPNLINKEVVDFCKQKGIKLLCGNTNNKQDIEKVLTLGVTRVCSDYPYQYLAQ